MSEYSGLHRMTIEQLNGVLKVIALEERPAHTMMRDAIMSELMDRAEADHRRWIIMRSSFGIKAEPAAGSARYSYRAGQYVAECLHCGEDIKTTTGSDYRVKWVHLGTESVYCGEWDKTA